VNNHVKHVKEVAEASGWRKCMGWITGWLFRWGIHNMIHWSN